MQKTIIRRPVATGIALPDSMHPVLRRVFAARNVQSDSDVDYSLASLLPYDQLNNIDAAVELLKDAIENKRRVMIVADFDADGATSCALAIRALTLFGLHDVTYLVPNRFEYGYGLTPEIVNVALEYDPELLITVDNGISSLEGVAYARQHNVKVMITDHHLPAAELPAADVIVNPQLPGDNFASKNLAGVGVMFYVLLALRARLREENWFEENQLPYPNLARFLDLVALGTVADVVPLDKNNRILVAHGLKLIKQNKAIPAINALLSLSGKSLANVCASDLGFSVAPRLNAAGRLTDMSVGIECLLSDNPQQAMETAVQLDKLNRERKQIQDEMQAQALFEMDNNLDDIATEECSGICLYHADWHQGVIGILAAKVKEKFNRPVIAFARDKEGLLKGSARSISSLHIRDLLEKMTLEYPGIIITFGGHAMAAGLTINETDFDQFKTGFEQVLGKTISVEDIEHCCYSDGELRVEEFSMQLAEDIQSAGPWGQAFPEPVFDGQFQVLDKRIVGGSHLKMKLQAANSEKILDAISFQTTDEDWPVDVSTVKAAYRLGINEYQNRRTLQLLIEHIEPL